MSRESPAEGRYLQFLGRAEAARIKAEETTDPIFREWWERTAEAWQYLADTTKPEK